MAVAVPSVTTTFLLNSNTSTLLGAPRADPNNRVYLRIDNLSKLNAVAFAHGTNNNAMASHHVIPPGSYYEFRWPLVGGMPLPQPGWGLNGDISAISIGGPASISYLEL